GCAIALLRDLCQDGWRVTVYYSNDNIHPYREWKRRLKALRAVAGRFPAKLEVDRGYPLVEWLGQALATSDRCRQCYWRRLWGTARLARDRGFAMWTTSLLASPRQHHRLICELGQEIALQTGTQFLSGDWRDGYAEGLELARQWDIYLQGYCGCIFSERDRYYRSE
ncbi:MAG: epoxyqueuosine reductase QueH, partial [Negativicutes bacterium]|nr:epoxyqueuosine reductase QueH [Negativicutes bacterium]